MLQIQKNNLAIIIVTYNPTAGIDKLVNWCCENSSNVIIVDNNSAKFEIISSIKYELPIRIIRNPANLGIGGAINLALKTIDFDSYKYILTFDQDSIPTHNAIEAYNFVLERENDVGLLGINYNHRNYITTNGDARYHDTLDLITSGLLHNSEIFKRTGNYNEKLFIDCVDFEFVMRVFLNGYRCILIDNYYLKHCIGNPKSLKIGTANFGSMNHSAFRQYYIVRNHIWLSKKYFRKLPIYIISKLYHLIIRIVKTFIIDDDRKNKIYRIIKGLIDGIKYNMD